MLDQDTARALLTIADETGARVALVGDRHQLPAVGRGGVLDLAHRWADPAARVDLDTVHRFVHTVDGRTRADTEYAQLSLAMRAGEDPAAVFDALHARGQIRVHASEAGAAAMRSPTRVAAARSAASPRRWWSTPASTPPRSTPRSATGSSPPARSTTTAPPSPRDGQRIGAGDTDRDPPQRPDPRRGQPRDLDRHPSAPRRPAHRHRPERRQRELTADYVRTHVELGYATTGYGAQGDTTDRPRTSC